MSKIVATAVARAAATVSKIVATAAAAADLEEPVGVVEVMLVDVLKGLLTLGSGVLPALRHVQADDGHGAVALEAEEQQLVHTPSPRGLHTLHLARTIDK